MLAACLCSAQTQLSLRDAVSEALRENPLLRTGAERVAVAEGLRRQAGLTFNPRLVLQSENTRLRGDPSFVYPRDTDNFAYLSQTLETAGKRDRRADLASAAVRRLEIERDLTARQIAGRVKAAYWIAAGAWSAERLLRDNLANFQKIVDYHEIRVKEGAMAEVDLIRVRLEGDRLEIGLTQAVLEAGRTRIQLLREMGRREFPAVTYAEALDLGATPEINPSLDEALNRRMEMKLAGQGVEVARSNLRLQQTLTKPNVDVLFGYKRTAGLDTVLGGLQFDLPLLNRNQGNVAAGVAEIRAAESSLAATEALIRAEVSAAHAEYEIRRRQVDGSMRTMRDKADETARIAEAAYREGGADLLRLLDAQRLRIETQLLYIQALAGFRQSAVALETALGVEP